jgi:hypothetical protein
MLKTIEMKCYCKLTLLNKMLIIATNPFVLACSACKFQLNKGRIIFREIKFRNWFSYKFI